MALLLLLWRQERGIQRVDVLVGDGSWRQAVELRRGLGHTQAK